MINIPNQRYMIDKYGYNEQSRLAMEECAELIQAINKVLRNKEDSINHLVEEISDVLIMIEQLKIMYNIDDSQIQKWIDFKNNRQHKIMEEGG